MNDLDYSYGVNHVNGLSRDIGSYYMSEDSSDIILKVQGEEFYAHKLILATRSEYFRVLFYGGLRESSQDVIELKDIDVNAFKELLKFIYTGCISVNYENTADIIECLTMLDRFAFPEMVTGIAKYLRTNLKRSNVCGILNTAHLLEIKFLSKACNKFICRDVPDFLENELYLQLNAISLADLLLMDNFYSSGATVIFTIVLKWIKANPGINTSKIIGNMKYYLMPSEDIINEVASSGLVPDKLIYDAIAIKNSTVDSEETPSVPIILNENLAHKKYNAKVIQGECPENLLDGDTWSYLYKSGKSTWHELSLRPNRSIIIELGELYLLNHIKILFSGLGFYRYAYYIEASTDKTNWIKIFDCPVLDHAYWHYISFEPRRIKYIKIVGINCCATYIFPIIHFECCCLSEPSGVMKKLKKLLLRICRVKELSYTVCDDCSEKSDDEDEKRYYYTDSSS